MRKKEIEKRRKQKLFKERMKRAGKFGFIMLLLLNVILPIVFAWLIEIGMEFKEDIYYTNGFWNTSPMQMYHIALNLMIDISIFTSAVVLYNMHRFFD
jgi:hypothetical protein